MSKNIVDAVLELNSDQIGFIPTRRQIDHDGGYVNNWRTNSFYDYVRSKSNITLQRDHGGPDQGNLVDDGINSIKNDTKYFDIIHIDPWKRYSYILTGIRQTIEYIKLVYDLNPNIKFEIGTEYAIRYFDAEAIGYMLGMLQRELLEEKMFDNIEYVVIQSGTDIDLKNKKNNSNFNESDFVKMIEIVNKFGKKAKEHNGDFLTNGDISLRFKNGLSAINIGPEIAQIETSAYLEHMSAEEIDKFYDVCLASEKWSRWSDVEVSLLGKRQLIEMCGHYNYNAFELPKIDNIVKDRIKKRLITLLEYAR